MLNSFKSNNVRVNLKGEASSALLDGINLQKNTSENYVATQTEKSNHLYLTGDGGLGTQNGNTPLKNHEYGESGYSERNTVANNNCMPGQTNSSQDKSHKSADRDPHISTLDQKTPVSSERLALLQKMDKAAIVIFP